MMTWFWIIASLLGLTATGFIILPVFIGSLATRRRPENGERDHINVGLYEERLADLNVQKDDDGISDDEFEQMRRELQRNLLDDTRGVSSSEEKSMPGWVAAGRLPLTLAIMVPVFAILVYADFGLSWGAISDVEIARELRTGDPHDAGTMLVTIERLAERLEQQPDNHEGQFLLAQSYLNLTEYEKASEIFSGLLESFSGDASLASYYAESLFLADQRKITPRVEAAIQKALILNPHELTMLEIKGMDAFQRGDLPASLAYFSKALTTAEGERAELIRGVVARIENQTGGEREQLDAVRSLQVLVELGDTVIADAESTVFVFAKAVKGPPMPLAVQKMVVSELPALVKLDESMGMINGMGLADFDEVQVIARISSSGIANAGPDDYEARSGYIDFSGESSVIKLTITKKIKNQ
jgi:cytochrome c-type biogenesis protein CcmH